MKRTVKIALTASVVLAAAATTAGLQAQQSAMTFFITSAGSGNGANLGGIEGADALCQKLASGRRRQRQDLARLSQHHRREVASTHATASAADPGRTPRARSSPAPSTTCTATRTTSASRPRSPRPARWSTAAATSRTCTTSSPARLRTAAPSAAARRTRPATTGPARTPVRRSSATTTARASTPRRRCCRGIRRIPRRAAPAGAGLDRRQRLPLLLRVELISVSRKSSTAVGQHPAAVAFCKRDATAPAQTPWRSARRSRAWSRRSARPPCRPPGPARS